MFASLSSFFPSALQQVSLGARPPDVLSPPPPTPPDDADVPPVDPPRKKEKKEKLPNEAFIIVRPPPSKSAQPLSLQVQLVPPQSRNDRPVQVLDPSPDDLNTDLRRTHSNGSEASAYSGYTSVGSVSSFASTSTASSGRRMIIPLYNLNVHSVMPTTILDAGTDAKVAKFARRGLEVIGLAFFEPIEVRPSAPANSSLTAPISARTSLEDSFREFGATPATSSRRPVSPARPNTSHVTVNASGDHLPTPIINLPVAPPPDMPPPQRSTKKLFTKMFKKKGAAPQLAVTVPLPDELATSPFSLRTSARISEDAPPSQPDTPHYDARPCTPLTSTATSQTAVLGVHSTLYPPVSNPRHRPTKYIWVVRKWLKGSDTSVLNGMIGKLSVGAREVTVPDAPHSEVRFEWSREPKKGNSRRIRDKNSSSRERSHSPSRRRVSNKSLPRSATQTLSPDVHDHRSSIASHNSSGSDTATSLSSGAQRHAEESGEESDPEDSETPWTCTVTAQRYGQILQHREREPVIRLKVATLAPTPHHPKVVGLLKVPFPLPDIEIERLVVRRRLVTAQGISKTTVPNAGEFILTAEEIKDTVSSTALWLVVREAFGGVGGERKKGKS